MCPFTATTTPTAFWFRNCLITLSYDFCIGSVIDSTCFCMILFARALAYELVSCSSFAAYVYSRLPVPAPLPPPTPLPLAGAAARRLASILPLALLTPSHTFCWLLSAIALLRTLGCSITDAWVSNFAELSTQRP